MKWGEVRWRRLYIREEGSFALLPLYVRALAGELLKFVDDEGRLYVGERDPAEVIARLAGAEVGERRMLRTHIPILIADGYLVRDGAYLVVKNFGVAQGRERKATHARAENESIVSDARPVRESCASEERTESESCTSSELSARDDSGLGLVGARASERSEEIRGDQIGEEILANANVEPSGSGSVGSASEVSLAGAGGAGKSFLTLAEPPKVRKRKTKQEPKPKPEKTRTRILEEAFALGCEDYTHVARPVPYMKQDGVALAAVADARCKGLDVLAQAAWIRAAAWRWTRARDVDEHKGQYFPGGVKVDGFAQWIGTETANAQSEAERVRRSINASSEPAESAPAPDQEKPREPRIVLPPGYRPTLVIPTAITPVIDTTRFWHRKPVRQEQDQEAVNE